MLDRRCRGLSLLPALSEPGFDFRQVPHHTSRREREAAREAPLCSTKLIDKGERFDLLVTDHLTPGMTGTDLARALRSARPGVPVLLVSGYAEREGIEPDLPRLTKPFRKDELAASLAQLSAPC